MTATITEDEAALYDRQIRLWGLDAQQNMRNATVLVVKICGVATETIKNIVLSGIGKLIVLDDEIVRPEDLGAGFFYRSEDINVKKRVHAAKPHIESLNPLVAVEVLDDASILYNDEQLEKLLNTVNLVCLTDSSKDLALRVNDFARRLNKKFYCGGSFGLSGYIFCDLLDHTHLAPPKIPPKDPQAPKLVQHRTSYVPLSTALQHSWEKTTPNQTRALMPSNFFSVLAAWSYQTEHGHPPSSMDALEEMQSIANELLTNAQVKQKVCTAVSREIVQRLATTAAHEFSPVCAVVGGMLGQDILKTLAGKEPPIANFFVFDGVSCNGIVVRMSMEAVYEGPPPEISIDL